MSASPLTNGASVSNGWCPPASGPGQCEGVTAEQAIKDGGFYGSLAARAIQQRDELRRALTAEAEHRKRLEDELAEVRRG